MKLFWVVLLIFLSLLEGSVTVFPLVLIGLLIVWIMRQESWVFILAFCVGMLLDIFLLQTPGMSSLYFVLTIFSIFLYERKYGVQTVPFVFFASFFSCLFYLLWQNASHAFFQAIFAGIVADILFIIHLRKRKRGQKELRGFGSV